jgi:hypothetical protein
MEMLPRRAHSEEVRHEIPRSMSRLRPILI